MKNVTAYMIGVFVTYILAVLFVSQLNIARVTDLGYEVGLVERLQTTGHDWLGMLTVYLPLIAIALLIAWLTTGLLISRWVKGSAMLYALAGFVGIIVLHQVMIAVFGIVPIAPARSLPGLLSQGLAGAAGGLLFYHRAFKAQPA